MNKTIDDKAVALLTFLVRKLGYSRVPQPVPLVFIQTGLKRFYNVSLTVNQIQYRIKKLVELGHLEKWSTKHHTHYKITYYRIPYLIKDHTNTPNTKNNLPATKKQKTKTQPTSPSPHTTHTHRGVDISKLKEKFSII